MEHLQSHSGGIVCQVVVDAVLCIERPYCRHVTAVEGLEEPVGS